MIDPNLIREKPRKVRRNLQARNTPLQILDDWVDADNKRSELIQKIEPLRKERNEASKNTKGKPDEATIKRIKELKKEIEELENDLKEVEEDWNRLIHQIPNMHELDVPIADDESGNIIMAEKGNIIHFDDYPAKDHLEVALDLDIIDFEAGAKVAGSQFYYLKNEGVLLENALIQYGLHKMVEKGYQLMSTPDMAKSRYYLGTGYAPKGDEAQTYEIKDTDLGLIATAEVTMAGYHADEIFDKKDLPKKYAALSHCFRKEAGAYGKYSKGLYRVHQFAKLEMFAYCTPDKSDEIHEEMLAIEEEIMNDLCLPYQVLMMCTGDLGAIAAKKYDVEAWMPGRGEYGEVTSTSNTTDYQARNLNIRYKNDDGENEYVHMLNGTAIALSRIPIAILENFQEEDGSVTIPRVLVPYMGMESIKPKNKK